MLIIDFQQTMIANLSKQLGNHQNAQLDENILRHMVLNSLRAIKKKFPDKNVVIACDSRRSWRKEVYPYYKANRAKARASSELDWTLIFETFAKLTDEIRTYFPYRVIQVEGAEADDIIGVLANTYGTDLVMGFDIEQIRIVSGDKDFIQLQRHANVKQWNHVLKREVTINNAARYLHELIIRGDAGDGVPNVLSDDDVLATPGKRQKPLFETKLENWMSVYPALHPDIPVRNWKRNEQLIDLRHTPDDIRQKVLEQYDAEGGKTRARLVNYFIQKRLKNLHENINDF